MSDEGAVLTDWGSLGPRAPSPASGSRAGEGARGPSTTPGWGSAQLAAAFEALAEAPDGIKRLRELVLQLAVRGKLVPQVEGEESALTLLERIHAKKAQLAKEGTIRKPKDLPPVAEHEVPFELPSGWACCRFEDVHVKLGAGSTPLGGSQVYVSNGVPFLRSQNVWNDGLRLDEVAHIDRLVHSKMVETTVRGHDVLLNITGASIGRAAIVPAAFEEANVSQHVAIVRQVDPELNRWVHLFLVSPHGFNLIMEVQVGISREGLSMARLREFALPIPPLAEQHRIVARVDALMSLLDRLEAARNTREATRTALRDAALAALRDADTHEEVETAWQRIAERMADLFTDPADLVPLRQTVLQLAVRGRLVRQDPSDEPAVPGKVPEGPFAAPDGWRWSTLGGLTSLITSGSRSWNQYYAEAGATFIRSQDIKFDRLEYDKRAYVNIPEGSEGTRTQVGVGDLLITITGANVGKCAHLHEDVGEAYVSQHVALIRPQDPDISAFGHLWLTADHGGRGLLLDSSYGAKPGLNLTQLRSLPFPLPPKAEQHRIVAKVNELTTLIDRLEHHLTTAREAQAAFAAAAVHHLDA